MKSVGILNKIHFSIHTSCMMKLYKSLIQPHIIYSNIISGNTRYYYYTKKILFLTYHQLFKDCLYPLFKKYKIFTIFYVNSSIFLSSCFSIKSADFLCILPMFMPIQQDIVMISVFLSVELPSIKMQERVKGPRLWNHLNFTLKSISSLEK